MQNRLGIAELLSGSNSFEFASDEAKAYRAFSEGIPIIAEDDPELLEDFYTKNKGEFWGDQIERAGSGEFRHFDALGKRFYFTFHKHKIREQHVKRLRELEAAN